MALVTITEAARLCCLSEKTIRRKIAAGHLSVQVDSHSGQARKMIDTSELLRVFGSMPGQVSTQGIDVSPVMSQASQVESRQHEGPEQVVKTQETLIAVLQSQLDARTQEAKELRAQITGLLEWRKPDPLAVTEIEKISKTRRSDVLLISAVAVLVCLCITILGWLDGYRLWFMVK